MITQIIVSDKIFESPFTYPDISGLLEPIVNHESESRRIGNNMEFKVTFTYLIEEFYTRQAYAVYKSDEMAELVVASDRVILPEQLYQAYQALEKKFYTQLWGKHKNLSIPLLKELHLLPYDILREELQFHVQKFGKS